ncbi:DUF3515 domain-containing protein [Amycolatopsis acidiphila]|uniref:DUF3515 domain-containing protein n=1 Tax=Amycolatopsis acidiphila TaxID=715473 RepID=A0A558AC05_9PSEU|nr:DUF3515 domain-containing protein [Amycolatopsis acidiphila]TVT21796.1 DUF3515 domain-containing protein [Amycolatopsis acidiphila]UIJ61515.1 DUF3515 domain-containing protein [Amycolatopsis acidiphila]GHG59468.1 hypothetical protein GCM10017788_12950 [Amycolatopsis acidiphila]
MPELQSGAPPRRLIVLAAVLAVALAVGVAVLSIVNRSQPGQPDNGPLALVPVPASQADSPECATLVPALPAQLISNGATLDRREIAEPAPPATVAWGAPDAIVLRCGLDRPPELTQTAQLRVVSGVQWLPVEGQGASTWYVVDRNVYIGLTVPDSAGTGPLQQVSDTVAATLKPVPLRF